jgi:hypothetical protein
MSVRFFYLSAALSIAACSFSDSVDFGPAAKLPIGAAGGSAGGAAGGSAGGLNGVSGASGASGMGSAGKSGASAGGKGGAGGAAPQPVSGSSNAGGPPSGMAGDGGAAGEPSNMPEPVCGNGIIEDGEECDGGNAGVSGCTRACRVSCVDHARNFLESTDHHCYAAFQEADFESARQYCATNGGHLATIGSAAENQLVTRLASGTRYLGGFEDVPLTSEGTGAYRWITGEPLSFKNWQEGEPDRAASRCGTSGRVTERCYEHCMAIASTGRWFDQRCDTIDGLICEWEPPGHK